MLFSIIVGLVGYYVGRSGMSIHEFLMLIERLIGPSQEE